MTISGPLKTNSMSFLYRSRVSWRYFLGWHMDGLWGTRLTMKRPWSEPKKHSRTWWTGLLSMWSREGGVGPLHCLLVSNCSPSLSFCCMINNELGSKLNVLFFELIELIYCVLPWIFTIESLQIKRRVLKIMCHWLIASLGMLQQLTSLSGSCFLLLLIKMAKCKWCRRLKF